MAAMGGKFVWHELLTSDPKAAAVFYGKIVGWKARPWDQDPSYTLLAMGDRPMAGAMVLPEIAKAMGAPPHWESYITTPDADATAALAERLGGRVLKPSADIPGYGRFAILMDPQGAVFVAFTPKQPPTGDNKPGVGDFFWHELITTNWQSALPFYQQLFGWDKTDSMDMGAMGTYQMFGIGGRSFGGMFNKPPSMPGPAAWLPYAIVPDVKKVVNLVKQLGGTVMNGPMEVPGGEWIVQGMDPQGAVFAIHSRKPAAAAPAAKAAPARRSKPAKKSKPARKAKAARKPTRKAAKKSAKRPAKSAGKKTTKKTATKKMKKGGRRR